MPVPPVYIFRINVTYVKAPADNAEITAGIAANKKWQNGYKNFKDNIRNHLRGQQTGRCAFCRCFIEGGTGYSTLEHLISKNNYPQFEFLPENLVFCCLKCNFSKAKRNSINNPILNKTLQQFPLNSDGFIIINPYYDNYEDHIDFIDEILIVKRNNSSKGEKTIEFYKLARPELAEQRAREFMLNQNQITHQLTQRLTNPTTSPNVMLQITNIIAQMPNWIIN